MRLLITVVAVGLAAFAFSGCDSKSGTVTKPSGSTDKHGDHGHDHGHDHGKPGPHGGDLVELGEEEYHAEITHDDESGKVTVWLLDHDAKDDVKTAATEITIETKVGDTETTYTLAAVSVNESDPPQASQFSIEDKTLVVVLHAAGHEGTTATLHVEINGKKYSQAIEHKGHDAH